MNNNKSKKQKDERTPIIDGDSRPDKNIEPDRVIGTVKRKSEKKITTERAADTDTLEDFKDAK
jgi:hypothetical protein